MSRQIPQGIEVLVLKAAVDPDFKQLLLQRRTTAAAAIELELTAAEATMLAAVPAAQLEAVIARASVPQEHRRAFLGQAAAAMLAALGAIRPAMAETMQAAGGMRVKQPPSPLRERKVVEERVIKVIAKRTGVEAKKINRDNTLVKGLGLKAADLDELRKDLEKQFTLKVPADDFKNLGTVGEMIDYVEKALKRKTVEERVIEVIADRTGVEAKNIKRGDTLIRDLGLKVADLDVLRKDLEKEFEIEVPAADFKKVRFVANVIARVEKAIKNKPPPPEKPPVSGGIRPGTRDQGGTPPFSCGGMWAPRSPQDSGNGAGP